MTPTLDFYSGAVADVYDLFFPHDREQVDEAFFSRRIAANNGPALEIGCGTGRLLLRLLKKGLEVEGLDLSADMLRICRQRAQAQGLDPTLHQASMADFHLQRRFATIFVPFYSFQILTDRRDAMNALRSFHEHALPGGELLITTWIHWDDILTRDQTWKLVRTGADPARDLFVTASAASHVNRTEQLQTNWFRYDIFKGGKLIDSTFRTETIRYYHKHELVLMLEAAGFSDIQVWGDESEEPATDAHTSWVVRALRP